MSDYLDGLSAEALAKLDGIQRTQEVPKNQILFLEGSEATAVYQLKSGGIRLFRTCLDGRDTTIHLVEPGEFFAGDVLFDHETYPVSAIAISASVLAWIPKERFRGLLDDTAFRNAFLTSLFSRMRLFSDQLSLLNTTNVEQRLARFLEMRFGRLSTIRTDLSKQDTAAAIMVRPETLSRALSRLKRANLLQWNHRTMRISRSFWYTLTDTTSGHPKPCTKRAKRTNNTSA